VFSNDKLDKTACYGSKALTHYRDLAVEIVREYENHVRLCLLADPDQRQYSVGCFQPSGSVHKEFEHSAHAYYDTKAFNQDELECAKALDKFSHVWVRNKDRLDYGIPLPLKSATSSTFYPDFLWWVNGTVWALDPTGQHLFNEKIRTKLLAVPAPLKIALVVRGKLDTMYRRVAEEGWTLVRLRLGNASPETFESIGDLLHVLVEETTPQEATNA
jgi:type III restriction enzyme